MNTAINAMTFEALKSLSDPHQATYQKIIANRLMWMLPFIGSMVFIFNLGISTYLNSFSLVIASLLFLIPSWAVLFINGVEKYRPFTPHIVIAGFMSFSLVVLLNPVGFNLVYFHLSILPILIIFLNGPKQIGIWALILGLTLFSLSQVSATAPGEESGLSETINGSIIVSPITWQLALSLTVESLFLLFIKFFLMNDKLRLQESIRTMQLNKRLIDHRIPMLKIDTTGIIQEANTAFCRMTKQIDSEFIGKPLNSLKLINSELNPATYSNILQHKTWNGEMKGCHINGTPVWMNLTTREIYDIHFVKCGYLVILEDVTKQQKMKHKDNYDESGAIRRIVFNDIVAHAFENFEIYHETTTLMMVKVHALEESSPLDEQQRHIIATQIYSELAKILRKSDVIARWDSTQFAILLPKTETSVSMLVAEKVLDNIDDITKGVTDHQGIYVGYASVYDNEPLEKWLRRLQRAVRNAETSLDKPIAFL